MSARTKLCTGRLEKDVIQKSNMYVDGKSDGRVVPTQCPNKCGNPQAEGMEGSRPAEENTEQTTTSQTPGPIRYPVPWALTVETSFVAHVNDYRDTLTAAGFHVTRERHRGAFALEFMQRMMARVAQGGPPALGLHLLMGEPTKAMLNNVHAIIEEGSLAPVELIARAV